MSSTRAVFTGDLIGSTRAAPGGVDAVFDVLRAVSNGLSGWTGGDPRLTRFSGDGWQVVIRDPRRALRALLCLQAGLTRSAPELATRVAIGFGPITTAGTASLADADGPAFHRSGRTLAAMKRGDRIAVDPTGAPPLAPAVFALSDMLIRRWTAPQAEALAAALIPDAPAQTEISARLGITPQSLTDRLSAAGFPGLDIALQGFEALDQAFGPDLSVSGLEA